MNAYRTIKTENGITHYYSQNFRHFLCALMCRFFGGDCQCKHSPTIQIYNTPPFSDDELLNWPEITAECILLQIWREYDYADNMSIGRFDNTTIHRFQVCS